MSPELSVVIPIFNGEKYLRECLDSIVNQSISLDRLEIIAVNDNSNDRSLDILNEYSSKFPNFKLISNNENLGAGESRNIGINEVKTDYLTFIDCDDFISPNAYEDSLLKIKENDADLLVYNWETYTGNGSVEPINIHQQSTDDNVLIDSLDDNPKLVFSTASWNKIYHKSLYRYLKFSNGTYDDNVAVVSAIINAERIFLSKDATYYYRKNLSSTTENITPKHALDLSDSVLELFNLKNSYVNLLNINFINDILFWVYNYDWDINTEKRIIERLSSVSINSTDLDSFNELFEDKDIYVRDILDLSKLDSETFLAKYKYFYRLNKVKAHASLYVDIGNGFNENDKVSVEYVPCSNNKLTFDLSGFSDIVSLRFDPLEGDFIKAKVNNISIKDANCENSINEQYQLFTNLDPNYILDCKITDELIIDFDLIFLNKGDIANLLINKNNINNETNQKAKKGRFKFF